MSKRLVMIVDDEPCIRETVLKTRPDQAGIPVLLVSAAHDAQRVARRLGCGRGAISSSPALRYEKLAGSDRSFFGGLAKRKIRAIA